jgi:hypothetical protein
MVMATVMISRYILLFAIICLLAGCACDQSVVVANKTQHALNVQIALPWPSYEISSANGCTFAISLTPGEVWSSKKATKKERVDIHLQMANGPLVMRCRSLDVAEGWSVYNIRDGGRDYIRIDINHTGAAYDIRAVTKDGVLLPTDLSKTKWFVE